MGDAGPGWHECQVGDPQLVWRGGGEIATHQVGAARYPRVGFGGAHLLIAPHPLDPVCPHQPGDLAPSDIVATTLVRLLYPSGPIDSVVVLPQRPNDRAHRLVALGR